jgi:hypothetical protein
MAKIKLTDYVCPDCGGALQGESTEVDLKGFQYGSEYTTAFVCVPCNIAFYLDVCEIDCEKNRWERNDKGELVDLPERELRDMREMKCINPYRKPIPPYVPPRMPDPLPDASSPDLNDRDSDDYFLVDAEGNYVGHQPNGYKSLKPFYVFERNRKSTEEWMDDPIDIPTGKGTCYEPCNYEGGEEGCPRGCPFHQYQDSCQVGCTMYVEELYREDGDKKGLTTELRKLVRYVDKDGNIHRHPEVENLIRLKEAAELETCVGG